MAGAIMMLTANFVMAALILGIFFRWLHRDERRRRRVDLESAQEDQANLAAWIRRTGRR